MVQNMIIDLKKSEYDIMAEYFSLYQPHIEINLLCYDENLAILGLVDDPPCSVEIVANNDEIDKIRNDIMQWDICCCGEVSSALYQLYKRYDWIQYTLGYYKD